MAEQGTTKLVTMDGHGRLVYALLRLLWRDAKLAIGNVRLLATII